MQLHLERSGMARNKARRCVARELLGFTPELLDGEKYTRAASLVLCGTALVSNPDGDAVRKSHELVRDALRGGIFGTFYLPSDIALQMLGLDDLIGMATLIDSRIGNLFAPVGEPDAS